MQIKVLVEVPPVEKTEKACTPPRLSPEERVRHYIELVESDFVE